MNEQIEIPSTVILNVNSTNQNGNPKNYFSFSSMES